MPATQNSFLLFGGVSTKECSKNQKAPTVKKLWCLMIANVVNWIHLLLLMNISQQRLDISELFIKQFPSSRHVSVSSEQLRIQALYDPRCSMLMICDGEVDVSVGDTDVFVQG